jgi:hypothetical protein
VDAALQLYSLAARISRNAFSSVATRPSSARFF